jgi:hypothetical protein
LERSYSLRHSCFRTLHQDSGGEVFNGLGNLQMSPRLSGKNEGPAQWFSGESTSSGIAADMHTSHGAPHILGWAARNRSVSLRFTNSSQPVFFRLLEAFHPDFSSGRVRFPLIASVVVKGVVKKPSCHLIRSVALEIILTAALFLLLGQACFSAEDLFASFPLSSGVAAISRGGSGSTQRDEPRTLAHLGWSI